jgi:hypothetical protein
MNSLILKQLEGEQAALRLEKALNKLMIERDSKTKHTDEHHISIESCVTISCKIYSRRKILNILLGVCLTVSGANKKTHQIE